jgi:hypothetical protein
LVAVVGGVCGQSNRHQRQQQQQQQPASPAILAPAHTLMPSIHSIVRILLVHSATCGLGTVTSRAAPLLLLALLPPLVTLALSLLVRPLLLLLLWLPPVLLPERRQAMSFCALCSSMWKSVGC